MPTHYRIVHRATLAALEEGVRQLYADRWEIDQSTNESSISLNEALLRVMHRSASKVESVQVSMKKTTNEGDAP